MHINQGTVWVDLFDVSLFLLTMMDRESSRSTHMLCTHTGLGSHSTKLQPLSRQETNSEAAPVQNDDRWRGHAVQTCCAHTVPLYTQALGHTVHS
jgi:hypothetical protein